MNFSKLSHRFLFPLSPIFLIIRIALFSYFIQENSSPWSVLNGQYNHRAEQKQCARMCQNISEDYSISLLWSRSFWVSFLAVTSRDGIRFPQDNKRSFELLGVCNPWHLFDPSLLAAPSVAIRREGVQEIKRCFFGSPRSIPAECRVLCSWDGRAKLVTRPARENTKGTPAIFVGFIPQMKFYSTNE